MRRDYALLIAQACGEHKTIRDARIAGCPRIMRVRDEVIIGMMPYAKGLARTLIRLPAESRVLYEDLEAAALMGLIEGVEGFDHTKRVKLETYVWNRIRKAVSLENFSQHWVIMRPPRALIEKYMSGKLSEEEFSEYVSKVLCTTSYNAAIGEDGCGIVV